MVTASTTNKITNFKAYINVNHIKKKHLKKSLLKKREYMINNSTGIFLKMSDDKNIKKVIVVKRYISLRRKILNFISFNLIKIKVKEIILK